MGKFKVGDRVVMTERGHEEHGYNQSNPRDVVGTYEGDAEYGHSYGYIHQVKWDNGEVNDYKAGEIEHYSSLPHNTIQLNQPYTSKNGTKWECIGIKDGIAFLSSGGEGDAYRFLLNGENLSQGGGLWDIKWDPVVEWVEYQGVSYNGYFKMKYPLIDGKPDFTQATVTPV